MIEAWQQIDAVFEDHLLQSDDVLQQVLQNNKDANLPQIDVAPMQGKMLYIYALMVSAKRILEIGTLGGYSSIWMARALPEGGELITLEYDEKHAQVAAKNIALAGLQDKITIIQGAALDSLPHLDNNKPFDLVFIDADKVNNAAYLEWALRYSRQGTVIIGDNVVRQGRILDLEDEDENINGVRLFLAKLAQEKKLISTAIQTVSTKGWDGFSLSIVQK